MATPDTPTTAAKARAWPRPILPEGNGRLMVRFMRESLLTSYTCQSDKDQSVDVWSSGGYHSQREMLGAVPQGPGYCGAVDLGADICCIGSSRCNAWAYAWGQV